MAKGESQTDVLVELRLDLVEEVEDVVDEVNDAVDRLVDGIYDALKAARFILFINVHQGELKYGLML